MFVGISAKLKMYARETSFFPSLALLVKTMLRAIAAILTSLEDHRKADPKSSYYQAKELILNFLPQGLYHVREK